MKLHTGPPRKQARDDGEVYKQLKAAVVKHPNHSFGCCEERRSCFAVVVQEHCVCGRVVLIGHDARCE